jgi:hypothetical protein
VPSSVSETPKRPREEEANDNDDASETNSAADEHDAKRAKVVVETSDAPNDNEEGESNAAENEGASSS